MSSRFVAAARRAQEAEAKGGPDAPYKSLNPRTLLASMTDDELQVRVKESDFTNALRTIVPSVSTKEVEHYEQLRQQFSADSEK